MRESAMKGLSYDELYCHFHEGWRLCMAGKCMPSMIQNHPYQHNGYKVCRNMLPALRTFQEETGEDWAGKDTFMKSFKKYCNSEKRLSMRLGWLERRGVPARQCAELLSCPLSWVFYHHHKNDVPYPELAERHDQTTTLNYDR